MIVKMKKITVISLAQARENTVTQLRTLGLLHVKHVKTPEDNTASSVEDKIKSAHIANAILQEIKSKEINENPTIQGAELVNKTLLLQEKISQLNDRKVQVERELDELNVWGNFNPKHIEELAEKGIYVKLYNCNLDTLPEIPDDCAMHEFERTKHSIAFALISKEDFSLEIPEVQLPEISPSELIAQLNDLKKELERRNIEKKSLALDKLAIDNYLDELSEDLPFATARDHIASHGILCYLQGFSPEEDINDFSILAKEHGWGILIEDTVPEDNVPTLIRNPKWLKPISVVFNFIDTFPGYHELDISPVFYLFFSLYYAILIGDAGYGMLFLLATIGVHIWKGKVIPKQPLYLMYVLNISMIIWGILTGSYFGVNLPQHAFIKKFVVLDTSNFGETVFFCFCVALAQLLIAHIWNIVRYINSWIAIAEVGRAGIVITMYFVANFLILNKSLPGFVIYLGIISIILAFVFSCIGKKGEDLLGNIFQFPFSVINSFGDIASYIRLFAVGYASMATAQAFNSLALNVGFDNILAGFFAALILILGHSLNMAMGGLAVLVHGLRLNMLEFSGHLGQEWSGEKYNPLKRSKDV